MSKKKNDLLKLHLPIDAIRKVQYITNPRILSSVPCGQQSSAVNIGNPRLVGWTMARTELLHRRDGMAPHTVFRVIRCLLHPSVGRTMKAITAKNEERKITRKMQSVDVDDNLTLRVPSECQKGRLEVTDRVEDGLSVSSRRSSLNANRTDVTCRRFI